MGDCRALLVYYPRNNVHQAKFEWLNSPHFPNEPSEWNTICARTRDRDVVPARPSFESIRSAVESTGRTLTEDELELVLKACGDVQEPFASMEDAYDYLAEQLRVPVETLFSCVPRVAGTLMVSRALGDAYLKRRSLSFDRFQRAEYIGSVPEMTVLFAQEQFQDVIVMASDGIWDLVSPEAVRDCIVDA